MAKNWKPDAKDFQILYELDKNARAPASKIAKIVGISEDSANYRLRRLLKNGIIFKFLTVLNTARLGLTTYKMFLRFQNTTPAKEEEIINEFAKNRHTQIVTALEGNFDLNINLLAFSVEELDRILDAFNSKYGNYFAEKEVMPMVQSNFFYRDYLAPEKLRANEKRKPVFFGSTPSAVKIDEIDKKILSLMGADARRPMLEIAEKVGLTPDAVIYRVRKLEHSGVIQNYMIVPDSECIGTHWNYLLVKFTPDCDYKRFFSFCESHPNIWFFTKMIGRWDALIGADTFGQSEFKALLTKIKQDFSASIREYSILRIPKIYKFNLYPF